jgi:hypothetical protein
MDAKKVFKTFLGDLRSTFPSIEFRSFQDSDISDFEEWCTPHVLKILQKDNSVFEEPTEFFGVNISEMYKPHTEMIWRNIQACTIGSFFSGDVKEKFNKMLGTIKGLWGDSGHPTDEIDRLLGSEDTQSKISDILEFVMSTRIAKVVINIVESVDFKEFEVDFENPDEVARMMNNIQGNPVIEKIMKKIQATIENKVRNGEFTKEMLMRDIESIKAKAQELFGDMFNDMLGTRKADVPSSVILSNSTEARHARMLARLRRKVNERKNPQ